jgi:hypothetical protein
VSNQVISFRDQKIGLILQSRTAHHTKKYVNIVPINFREFFDPFHNGEVGADSQWFAVFTGKTAVNVEV